MEAADINFGLPETNIHVARAGIFALAAGGIMPVQHEHQPFKRWANCPSYWILAFFVQAIRPFDGFVLPDERNLIL
jgi:hypothetical protein